MVVSSSSFDVLVRWSFWSFGGLASIATSSDSSTDSKFVGASSFSHRSFDSRSTYTDTSYILDVIRVVYTY